MADQSSTKIAIAAGVLALLGGAFFVQQNQKKEERAAHSFEGQNADLPKLSITEEATKKITRLVIEQPPKEADPKKPGDAGKPASKHVLTKNGESWSLTEPLSALANQSNVESLLNNLAKLAIKERIAKGADSYAQYDVSDDKAVHVTAFEGDKAVVDLYLGKSGGRGQMVRVKDKEGVYILDGYSSYLYTRDTKGFRDLSIFKLETDKAVRVDIENEKGAFAFKKEGGSWKSDFKKAKGGASAIKDFEGSKVDDLLRAYKSLNASDFGDGKSAADTGLDKPTAKLVITLESGQKQEIHFGGTGEGSSRWAKVPEKETIFAVSSWASDWALADETKFQKKKDDKKSGDAEAEEAPDPHAGLGLDEH